MNLWITKKKLPTNSRVSTADNNNFLNLFLILVAHVMRQHVPQFIAFDDGIHDNQ